MRRYSVELIDISRGQTMPVWVKREIVDHQETKSIMALRRAAKRAVGMTGVRGAWYDTGKDMKFSPNKLHFVLVVRSED